MCDTSHLNERYSLIVGGALGYKPADDKFSNPKPVMLTVLPSTEAQDKSAIDHFNDKSTPTALGKYYGYLVNVGMNYVPGVDNLSGDNGEGGDKPVIESIWTMDPTAWAGHPYEQGIDTTAFTDSTVLEYSYSGNDLTVKLSPPTTGGVIARLSEQDVIDGITLSVNDNGTVESVSVNNSNIGDYAPYFYNLNGQWIVYAIFEVYVRDGENLGMAPQYTLTFNDGRTYVVTLDVGIVV